MRKNMFVFTTHDEPSNDELGIKPWSKLITYPMIAIVGGAIWYLGYLVII